MNNLPTYKLTLKDDEDGVNAISLVEYPAIEFNTFNFSEMTATPVREYQMALQEDKQIMMGPALVPDQLIYRNHNGYEYQVYVTKNIIEQVVERFAKSNYNTNTTHQHESPLTGNVVMMSWIVDREKGLDSAGFDVPDGTWMLAVKVNDKDYWEDEVKARKVNGFSIEAFFTPVLEKEQKMSIMSAFTEKMAAVFNKLFGKTELAASYLADYTPITIVDNAAYYVDEFGKAGTPLPTGTYDLADGSTIMVGENGLIDGKTEQEVVDVPVDGAEVKVDVEVNAGAATETEETVEVPATIEASKHEEIVAEHATKFSALEAEKNELADKLATALARIAALEAEPEDAPLPRTANLASAAEKGMTLAQRYALKTAKAGKLIEK